MHPHLQRTLVAEHHRDLATLRGPARPGTAAARRRRPRRAVGLALIRVGVRLAGATGTAVAARQALAGR